MLSSELNASSPTNSSFLRIFLLEIRVQTICTISLFTLFCRILITLKFSKLLCWREILSASIPKSKLFRLPIKSFSRGKYFYFFPASYTGRSLVILETIVDRIRSNFSPRSVKWTVNIYIIQYTVYIYKEKLEFTVDSANSSIWKHANLQNKYTSQ